MQWEYKTLRFNRRGFFSNRINTDEIDRKLNDRGNAGWEVVGVTSASHFLGLMTDVVAILKRPKD